MIQIASVSDDAIESEVKKNVGGIATCITEPLRQTLGPVSCGQQEISVDTQASWCRSCIILTPKLGKRWDETVQHNNETSVVPPCPVASLLSGFHWCKVSSAFIYFLVSMTSASGFQVEVQFKWKGWCYLLPSSSWYRENAVIHYPWQRRLWSFHLLKMAPRWQRYNCMEPATEQNEGSCIKSHLGPAMLWSLILYRSSIAQRYQRTGFDKIQLLFAAVTAKNTIRRNTLSWHVVLMFCEYHHTVWRLIQKCMFSRKATLSASAVV